MSTSVSGQQFVILARGEVTGDGLVSLGTRAEIAARLRDFNTSAEREGDEVLYGPGIRIELPPSDPVTQMLLTVMEEEIAWQVIMRLSKEMAWRLLDPSSGRELSP